MKKEIGEYSKKGFTLIELLVAIVIIAIIASFSFSLMKDRKKDEDMKIAVRQIAVLLRESQNSALTGRMQADSGGNLEAVCNYFVTMVNVGNVVKVNSQFSSGDGTPPDCDTATPGTEKETILKNVNINDVAPNGMTPARKIKFAIPSGKPTITGPSQPSVKIYVFSKDNPEIKGGVCIYKSSGEIKEVFGDEVC